MARFVRSQVMLIMRALTTLRAIHDCGRARARESMISSLSKQCISSTKLSFLQAEDDNGRRDDEKRWLRGEIRIVLTRESEGNSINSRCDSLHRHVRVVTSQLVAGGSSTRRGRIVSLGYAMLKSLGSKTGNLSQTQGRAASPLLTLYATQLSV